MNPLPVLFLNGTSSSGKTSAARALQREWREPLLYVNNDAFIYMFSEAVLKEKTNLPKVLPPILSAFHRSLPLLAGCGFPMVVDAVIEQDAWMRECVTLLADYNVIFIGVHCSVDELDRREVARGNRHVGFARWQFDRVHRFGPYDFELHTDRLTPEQCGRELAMLLRSAAAGTAFPRLRAHYAAAAKLGHVS
jgi:chloramphenicol 3-O phosphotransferase